MDAISAFQALSQTAAQIEPAAKPEAFALWITVGIAIAVLVILVLAYYNLTVHNQGWTLKEALSEPVVGLSETAQMKPSLSRFIAFFGLIAILALYVGAGLIMLHKFALDGSVPASTADAMKFLMSGGVLFAPYLIDKFTPFLKGWFGK